MLSPALWRGERPEIERYAPDGSVHRKVVLFELLHEEMEVRIKAGEPFRIESYLARFPELASDPDAVSELFAAESDLLGRPTPQMRTTSDVPETADRAVPSCIGRYELGDLIGQGAFGLVYRAWDTTLNRAIALKRPRPGGAGRARCRQPVPPRGPLGRRPAAPAYRPGVRRRPD